MVFLSPVQNKGAESVDLDNCRVLVVEDDVPCREEYAETIGSLGYACSVAADPVEGLRMILEDRRIGIVVTDLGMPKMDGISFLDELATRFVPVRPLVCVVVTGQASLDVAVQAMRANAFDFLAKPVRREDLAAALRRAFRQWARTAGQFRLLELAKAAGGVHLPDTGGGARPASTPERPATPADDESLRAFVRTILHSRQKRAEFLDPTLFADPAWDILLDLTTAAFDGKPVPVSSVCAAAQVPFSTALRHVRQLVQSGLVKRWQDPADKRRDLLQLEEETFQTMHRYLTTIHNRF